MQFTLCSCDYALLQDLVLDKVISNVEAVTFETKSIYLHSFKWLTQSSTRDVYFVCQITIF